MKVNYSRWTEFFKRFKRKAAKHVQTIPELIGTEFRHVFTRDWTVLDTCLQLIKVRRGLCRDEQHFVDVIGLTPTKFLVGVAKGTLKVSIVEDVIYVVDTELYTISAADRVYFTWYDRKDLPQGRGSAKEIVRFMEQIKKLKDTTR